MMILSIDLAKAKSLFCFFDTTDQFIDEGLEEGPLGNDTGHDVFADYKRWRADGKLRGQFLPHLLRAWEIGDYDRSDRDWVDRTRA